MELRLKQSAILL